MLGWSSHLSFRLMTMMRGQLISLIYTKVLELPITDANESAAMTLMGTDVQAIASSYYFILIEMIPNVIQLAIAIYLLYTQIGAVCVAPVLVTLSRSALQPFSFLFDSNGFASFNCMLDSPSRSYYFQAKAMVSSYSEEGQLYI